jgi:hypothetical protein
MSATQGPSIRHAPYLVNEAEKNVNKYTLGGTIPKAIQICYFTNFDAITETTGKENCSFLLSTLL